MTRTTCRALILATLALFASGAALAETLTGSGRMATESRAVSGFNGLSVAVSGKVRLTQGNTESVTITADDNALAYIETFVDQGMLRIRWKKPDQGRSLNVNRVKISITVVARDMEAIAVGGSADVAAGPIKAERLVASIGGSGNLDIASVEAGDVSARIGGSGDLAIRGGRTNTLDVRIGGSGDVQAAKLESRSAKVRIGGSGEASLWVRDTLKASVAGSGSVRYFGDPKVERAVAGSGEVRRAGASPT